MKDFSEFAGILISHSDRFQRYALNLVDRASENGVVDANKLLGLLPSFNLKTCVEVLELYHSWISGQNP